ncbi:hypothetical protein GCM10007100_02650 [Roseibacillus persicicus]|uniref:Uncharacterized protein n=1 Tax=Roseibacillus persicicus TaxID=454148 RepID=A0A918TCI1_9BACT|nr:hypothetical protein GCM10007100_02650 [Roseibacillus persicicus]
METVATYYFPFSESDIFNALDTINAAAEDPVTSYNSLSIAYDGTIILYDHWEDNGTEGYEAFRNDPTQVATQVWGDGNLVNGVAPGYPDDLLDAGDVIILQNTFETSDAGSQFYFDGRDKISTSKYVAITRAAWADNTATLLAGAWEMYPTSLWGYEFTLPIGEDLADSVDFQAFEFVGASVMSALDNNEIRLNGTLVATINEGETFTWNGGLNLGDEIVTSRVAQVQLITGDINSNYESRWYTLPPEVQFSNSYVAPVSTRAESATLVWLFNPNSTAIDVEVESSSSATQTLNIPANAVISYELTNGDAARFGSTNGETFFALASVDSGDADYTDTNGNTVNENITNDWGFSLVPDVYLTPLVVVGLAPGDDPTFVGAVENSAPIWATAVFPRDSVSYEANRDADPNNDVQITVCVDYNGNGNVDGLSTGGTDPLTGLGYDYQVTIDELDQMIIYVDLDEDGIPDPGADQTGTRIWICDGGTGLLAVAYGQDPDTASVGSPAVDLGTTVPGIPVMALAKDALFENDYNGNGSADIGDQLKYTIVVENSGTGSFPADVVNLLDNLSTHLAYVPGTATLTDSSGTTSVPDNGAGTLFPIDEDNGGFVYEKVLPPGEGFSLVFVAEVVSLPADGTGAIINSVVGQGGTQVIPVTANAPVAFPQGAIGGTVYVDTTGDGNGDTPLDGVEVTLLYSDGSFVDFDPTTPLIEPYTITTINGGQYYFPNLPAGDYLVSQSQPSGYVTVTDGDTTSPEDDAANSSTTDNLIPVTILENEIDDGNDFVEEIPAPTEGSLSGTVYVDQDNDGIGDIGLSGVVVTLKDSAGNDIDSDLSTGGVQPTTTTTATNGSYSFAGLPAGDYQVVESQPSGYVSVSDVDGANNDTIGDETAITVVAGSDAGGNDFIEEQLGSLSGIVFEDLDGNGTGDVAIGGVVLTLKDSAGNDIDSDPVASGVQPTVTTTASNGSYSFSNLRPGDYQVVETQPTGYISVSDADGGNLDLIGDQSLIPVVGGANSSGNNFVEEALPATISGTVLADIDNDNLGEVGIQGVTLTLKDEFGNDIDSDPAAVGVQPTTTTTDSNGEYSFTGLVAGNYQVVESQPSGYDSVSDVDGVNNNVIGDENAIVLTAGSTSSGNDFVEEQTANIRGTVRADTNGNGTLQNNDTIDLPIAGVTVRLFTDPNGDGDPSDGVEVTSLSTNANGDYNFAGISPGTYVVVEDQPEGYFSLLDQDFSNVSDDAADLGVDNSIPVSVTAGENDNRNDFLEVLPGSISGTVLADTDNDDLGDTAIEGVVLTLKDASGNDIDSDPVASGVQPTVTATDEFGAYSFTGLFPADYRVVETQPSGYDSVSDVDGANNDIIGDETAISVTGGSDSSGNDFVEEAPGSLSGTVLADTDNNNTGDTAIEGVVLTLKDAAGNDIDSDPVAAGVQPTTTVTDEFGAYSFTNLTPGDYQVVETQPSGYDSVSDVDGANNNIVGDETPITVSAGSNSSGNDFVEEQPGSLSGTVLADTDNDDAGDTAIEGVVLTLKDAAGNDIDSDPVAAGVQPTTTVTDEFGAYSFTNLTPGDYQVVETQPSGYDSVSDVDGANNDIVGDETPITVSAGSNSSGNDFVEEQPGSLSGTVLADTDNDDAGDTAIEGVVLTLKDAAGNDIDSDPVAAGVQPTTTVTDEFGAYSFTNLTPGDYQVVETQPSGYDSVSDVDGANNDIVGDETAITVSAGSDSSGNDFVEEQPGSLSGTVLADTDNNNTGDTAIEGVVLTLKDAAGNDIDSDPVAAGVQPTTTVTDEFGAYSFTNLTPGDYQVVETQPSGYDSVSDVDGANNDIVGDETAITVIAGSDSADNDFVEEQQGVISGFVYEDNTGDGFGNVAIESVELALFTDPNGDGDPSDGVQVGTATTLADGSYTFTGVSVGNYVVVETQPSGLLSVRDYDGSTPGDDVANIEIGDEWIPVSVTAGETDTLNNFIEAQPAVISGTVLADTDNDGFGDEPIEGVVITLTSDTGDPIDADGDAGNGVQLVTATTASDGSYSFPNVLFGDYGVQETQPTGFDSVSDGDTTTPGDDAANTDTLDDFIPVSVLPGETDDGNDFVEEAPGSISGTVLADTDNDDAGDTAIEGVVLTLKDAAGNDIDSDPVASGVQPTTTTTDETGAYSFNGLTPGDYQVVETQPSGFDSVSDVDGANNDVVGDETPISVTAGNENSGNDFVEEEQGSISGTVLADTDDDDLGDTAIEGVVLTLKDAAGNDIDSDPVAAGVQPTTTTTDENGSYTFAGLPVGDYQVVETQPSGFDSVSDVDGANNDVVGDETPISVTAGNENSGNDFVEEEQGSISGTVLADTDDDDLGDTAIEGVVLTLKDATGNDIDSDPVAAGVQPTTTTTDENGSYTFAGLPVGDYQVVETQPSGFDSVSDVDGANNDVVGDETPISVTAGNENSGNDFVEEEQGSISGTVLADTDDDDLGDTAIEGVVLTLKDAAGNDIDSDPVAAGVQPTTTTTDENGSYTFAGLPVGDYQVVETQPSGFDSVSDVDGANNDVVGDETPISVTAGNENSGNDFVEEEQGSISGTVLADADDDDLGDTAIEGVVLTLKDAAGNDIDSDPVAAGVQPTTTTTDENGSYTFAGLPVGDYQVVETQPSGFDSVSDVDGANNDVVGDETPISVTAGNENSGNNFVEEEQGSISGTVLADTDDDDLGDTAIEGVVLTLKDATGNDIDSDPVAAGVQPTTTTTDENGSYTFAGLPVGDYQVVETQPSGFDSVSDVDGVNNDVVGDETPISVTAGNENSGNDFVEEAFGSVSGTVLADTDNNGTGDTGLSGVVLTLKDSAGNDIDSDPLTEGVQPTTTTTDGNGDYTFNNVPVGSYQVVETQPTGYSSVSDVDGANNDVVGDETPILVTPGNEADNNDFVELQDSSKADTYAGFVADNAGDLGSETGLGENPDGDIYPNALEYAFCLEPGSGLPGGGEFCLEKASDGSVTAQFWRPRGGLSDVTYTLEGADTLGTPTTWTTLASVSSLVETSGSGIPFDAERVTYENIQAATELSSPANGVIRLKVEVDADESGAIEAGEVFYTRIFGWQCNLFNDYECGSFSSPFMEKPSLSGTFGSGTLTLAEDSGTGDVTLDVSDSVGSLDLSSVVGSNGAYYLQITSGVFEGHRFDILEGGVGSITLLNDDDIFDDSIASLNTLDGLPTDSGLNNASFEVIRYRTIDEMFDKETAFAGEEDSNPADATRLLFYDVRKAEPGFDTLMLVGDAPNTKWIRVTDPFAQLNQGGRRLDPAMGCWIHPKSSGNALAPDAVPPVEQFTYGIVADYDQACPMNEGFNLTGAMWPLDQSPAGPNGRDLTLAAGFDGGTAPNKSTEILFWKGDRVVDEESVSEYQTGYIGYMLADAGPYNYWLDLNDRQLSNRDADLVLESNRALMVKILAGDEKKSHIYPLPQY